MSFDSRDYAALSKDSYEDRSLEKTHEKPIFIGNKKYKIFDTYSNPLTGYQGTAYQRMGANGEPTGEIIIAHRGTEKPLKDLLDAATDAGMVFTGINAQALDAEAFTGRVIQGSMAWSKWKHQPVDIHVTGHSLGGTLAELTAYKFHLHGETFNAYGAAGLMHDVPEGSGQVINHVRATDVVSAASAHFGEVHIYATSEDIDHVSHAHYHEDGSGFWRNALRAADLDAHGIDNFVPDAQGHSALDPENVARYRAHHTMVDRFRQDVLVERAALSTSWELLKASYETGQSVGQEASAKLTDTFATLGDAALQSAQTIARAAEQAGQRLKQDAQQSAHAIGDIYDAAFSAIARGTYSTSESMTHTAHTQSQYSSSLESRPPTPVAPVLMNDRSHPGHALFQQSLQSIHELNAAHGVASSERDERFAGSLATAAATAGLTRVDRVTLSEDAKYAFAICREGQQDLWGMKSWIARVETVTALSTPLLLSSEVCVQAMQQRSEEEAREQVLDRQREQAQEHVSQATRAWSR